MDVAIRSYSESKGSGGRGIQVIQVRLVGRRETRSEGCGRGSGVRRGKRIEERGAEDDTLRFRSLLLQLRARKDKGLAIRSSRSSGVENTRKGRVILSENAEGIATCFDAMLALVLRTHGEKERIGDEVVVE